MLVFRDALSWFLGIKHGKQGPFQPFLHRLFVNVVGMVFGEDDFLAGINAKIPGNQVAEGTYNQKIGGGRETEEFAADQQRGNRTVRHAAENAAEQG